MNEAVRPRRFQFGIGTLLLLTALVAVGLGWWVDRLSQEEKQAELIVALAEGANREALAAERERRLEGELNHLKDKMDTIREIEQLSYALDVDDPEQAAILRDLGRLGVQPLLWGLSSSSDRFEQIPLPVSDDASLMVVILHNCHDLAPKPGQHSLVLLFKYVMPPGGEGMGQSSFVDSLERRTGRFSFHEVTFEDRDGDGEAEVVFDFPKGLYSEGVRVVQMYRPTPEGFVELGEAETSE